jgi:nucleoid-associated protein YgaU
MQRKLLGIVLVCVVLLVAIVAGYWDMLQSERLRISAPPETVAETEIAAVPQATALEDAVPQPETGQRAGGSSTAGDEVSAADGAETALALLDQDDAPMRAPAASDPVPPAMTPPVGASPEGASTSKGSTTADAPAGEDVPAAAGTGTLPSSSDQAVAATDPDLEGEAASAGLAGSSRTTAEGATPASRPDRDTTVEAPVDGQALATDSGQAAAGTTPGSRPGPSTTAEAPSGGEAPADGGEAAQASRQSNDTARSVTSSEGAVPGEPAPEPAEATATHPASGGEAASADRAASQAASRAEAARRRETARTGTEPRPMADAPAADGVAAAGGAETGEASRDGEAAQAPDRSRVTTPEPLAPETAEAPPAEAKTDDPQPVQAQTTAPTGPAEAPGRGPATEDVASRAAPEAGARNEETDAGEMTPRFDLLRVEPDGATVIAGRAAPGSRIALRDGDATVGTDTANASGEFAIALDSLLEPGDHAIRIVATAEDGRVAVSEETAIVSVPQPGRDSELLAMVEAPNEPSRLISIPGSEPGAAGAAAASPSAASPSGAPPSTAAASDASAPAQLGVAREDSVASAPDAGADTVTLPRAEAEARESAAAPSSVPMLRVEAVEIEAGQVYVAGAAEAGSLVRVYIDNVLLAEDRATPAGRFLVNADATVAPGDHVVRADQVARDGSVSERAEVPFQRPEGPSVAMVAPRPDVGAGVAGADHTTASGDAAAARDDGPAAPEPASAAPAAAPASVPIAEDDAEIVSESAADGAAASANTAPAAPEPPSASAAPAAASASAPAVEDGAEIALEERADDTVASADAPAVPTSVHGAEDDAEIVSENAANGAAASANTAPAAPGTTAADDLPAEAPGEFAGGPSTDAVAGEGGPADVAGDEPGTRGPSDDAPRATAGLDATAGRPAGTEAPATRGAATAPAEAPVPSRPEAGEADVSADPSAVVAAPESVPVTRQQALTTAPGRVIIRRGDTLWRISRENYGLGSRYVVIYLANGDQIRDPDLIYPGQVFSVPEERVDTSDAGGAG